MSANYNNSAWFYDRLSRMVYGRAIINAQVFLLQYIQPKNKILIAGGGTGWILEEIAKVYPGGLIITYVEVAANMMSLSQKRDIGNNEVKFINKAIENVTLTDDFDVLITPFLFDNFTEQTLIKVFEHMHQMLKPDGIWLNTDFQLNGKWWQWILLKSMFLFFKIICNVEASKLPEIEKLFSANGYEEINHQTFFNHFIISRVYRNNKCN